MADDNSAFDNDLLVFLEEYTGGLIKKRPPGFGITVRELVEAKGVSQNQARKLLNDMWRKGELDRKRMIDDNYGSPPYVYFEPD